MNLLSDRRQEEKERRRNEILDAAIIVARDNGLGDTTMDMVAKQARLSRALIYVYFNDRDELMFALCERALCDLCCGFIASMQRHERGLDKIRSCGEAYLRFARERPVEFDILSRYQAHTPDLQNMAPNERACMLAGDKVQRELVAALELGVGDGSIRADVGPPGVVAATLWGFLHGVLQLARTKGNVLAHEAVDAGAMLDLALKLASRGIEADATSNRPGVPS